MSGSWAPHGTRETWERRVEMTEDETRKTWEAIAQARVQAYEAGLEDAARLCESFGVEPILVQVARLIRTVASGREVPSGMDADSRPLADSETNDQGPTGTTPAGHKGSGLQEAESGQIVVTREELEALRRVLARAKDWAVLLTGAVGNRLCELRDKMIDALEPAESDAGAMNPRRGLPGDNFLVQAEGAARSQSALDAWIAEQAGRSGLEVVPGLNLPGEVILRRIIEKPEEAAGSGSGVTCAGCRCEIPLTVYCDKCAERRS
jgi:hypothetical protein